VSGERLDAADRYARLWTAQDRIARHAQSIARRSHRDVDPAVLERLEDACADGDLDALLAALADLLDEVEA
jgi:hypothetical protein